MKERIIAPGKTANTPFDGTGIYIGIVKQIEGKRVYVEVPEVAPGFFFGPCLIVSNAFSLSLTKQTVDTPTGTTQAVTNATLANVAFSVNDFVLCAFINGEKSELVIMGRIL